MLFAIIIHGKGRKQREVPLWKTTVKYINKYLKTYPAKYNGLIN